MRRGILWGASGRAGADGGESRGRVWAGAGAGLLDVDHAGAAADGWSGAGCPKLWFGVVDVRDVADLHIRAMTHPEAKGDRFLAVAGDFVSMREMARVLKSRMGVWAKRVPTVQLPNWMVRLVAMRDPAAKQIVPELGKRKNATNEHCEEVAGVGAAIERRSDCGDGGEPGAAGLLKDSRKVQEQH